MTEWEKIRCTSQTNSAAVPRTLGISTRHHSLVGVHDLPLAAITAHIPLAVHTLWVTRYIGISLLLVLSAAVTVLQTALIVVSDHPLGVALVV